jgi:hypothetical protein
MFKHNKKQNTAILYECLIKELAVATINSDKAGITSVLGTIKEFFSPGSPLRSELDLYKNLAVSSSPEIAAKLLQEMKVSYESLNKEVITEQQKKLVKKMGETRRGIFSHFIPNYRTLASIYQIFRKTVKPHERLILEGMICEEISKPKVAESAPSKPLSSLVYRKYVENFNAEYKELLTEQKELLRNYILGGTEFTVFLNEEIGRLRTVLTEGELKNDSRSGQVVEMLNQFKESLPTKEMVERVLKIQELANEATQK